MTVDNKLAVRETQALRKFTCAECDAESFQKNLPNICSNCGSDEGIFTTGIVSPISGTLESVAPENMTAQEMERYRVENNLVGLEVTPEQWTQTLGVELELLGERAGNLRWSSTRCGPFGINLALSAAWWQYKHYFKEPDRPRLNNCNGVKIRIQHEANRLQLIFEPTQDIIKVKSVLAAALFGLIEASAEPQYDPVNEIAGALNLQYTDDDIVDDGA